MKSIKKIGLAVLAAAIALSLGSCATTASAIGKKNSPTIFEYGIDYGNAYDYSIKSSFMKKTLSVKDNIRPVGYRNSSQVMYDLEIAVSKAGKILDEETLNAKIAEKDALAEELAGKSKVAKFFDFSGKQKQINDLEQEIKASAEGEKYLPKIPGLRDELAAAYEIEDEIEAYAMESLKKNADFTLVDDDKVLAAAKKELERRAKKEKRKAFFGAVGNLLGGLDSISNAKSGLGTVKATGKTLAEIDKTADILKKRASEDNPRAVLENNIDIDMRKALKKGTKCKSFVNMRIVLVPLVYDLDESESAFSSDKSKSKPYAQSVAAVTTVKIINEKGETVQSTQGYVQTPVLSREEAKADPKKLAGLLPETMKASIDNAVSNLHIKEKRKAKPDFSKSVDRDATDLKKDWRFYEYEGRTY